MTISAAQKKILSDHLNDYLRYRETHAEFYDHVLSALETKPEDMPFSEAVITIINEDFGGHTGLSRIEKQYKTEAAKEVKKRYLIYLIDYFKSPLVILTIALISSFYYLVSQPWFNFWDFAGLLCGMRIAPGLLRFARKALAGYIFTRPTPSVKDGAFKWLDYLPVFILAIFIIIPAFGDQTPPVAFAHANHLVLTLLLMMFAMHTVAYFRIYKNELKTSISK